MIYHPTQRTASENREKNLNERQRVEDVFSVIFRLIVAETRSKRTLRNVGLQFG